MNHIRLGIALLEADQVKLLGQKIDLVLLLGRKLVVRFLNKFELLCDNCQLAFLLLSPCLQSTSLVTRSLELLVR